MQPEADSDRKSPDPAPNPAPESSITKPKRVKPARPLPTTRVNFDRQLRCLRSYGLESHNGTAPVKMETVAKAVGLNSSTLSLCNPYFVDAGLLSKSSRGSFVPSPEVLEMVRAYDWDPDSAPQKLAEVLRQSWMGRTLEPRLRLGPIDADEAIRILADSVKAGPAHKAELNTVLEYLLVTGVIRRDGNQLSWIPASTPEMQDEAIVPKVAEENEGEGPEAAVEASRSDTVQVPGAGGVSFTVEISVSAEDIASWSPDRITAFFGGLAQVLAAQRKEEGR